MNKAVEFKVATVMAVAVVLPSTEAAKVEASIKALTSSSNDLYTDELAVVDLSKIDKTAASPDWAAMTALFRKYRLNLVAVRHAPEAMEAAILKAGLSIDQAQTPREHTAASVPSPAHDMAPVATKVIDTPIRAGQRIEWHGDIIITQVVNNGAEIIADGNIHIYAPLRGKALAGARGNQNARIYAMVMEPELISISGIYQTFEDGFPEQFKNAPCQVTLKGEALDIAPIIVSAKN